MAIEQLALDPDSPEGLAELIEQARKVIDDPGADRFAKAAARTNIRCFEDRQQVLAFARKHGGLPKIVETTYKQRTPNEIEYRRLQVLAQKLFPPVELKEGESKEQEWETFLHVQFTRHGVKTAEGRGFIGFTWDAFLEIHLLLEQFLEKQPKSKSKKKSPVTPELECKQITAGLCHSTKAGCVKHRSPYPLNHQFDWEGSDREVTSIEWAEMRQWAQDNGIDSTTQYALMGGLGMLGHQKGAQIPDLQGFRLFLRELRLRIMKKRGVLVRDEVVASDFAALEKVFNPTEKPKPPMVNLFAKVTKDAGDTTKTDTGEVVHRERTKAEEEEYQRKVQESRQALGYDRDYSPQVETREDVTDALKERAAILNEYAFIVSNYRTAVEGLQAALNGWSFLYEQKLESWLKSNPIPGDKKTLKDLYGEIGWRNQPESYSQGEPEQLQAALHLLVKKPELAELYEVRPGDYVCNWEKLKADIIAKRVDVPKGAIKHTPAVTNKFRVGPSLNTVQDNVRDGKYKRLGGQQS